MGIKDITLSENIHTITAAIENKKENFDTENKMREDLLDVYKRQQLVTVLLKSRSWTLFFCRI